MDSASRLDELRADFLASSTVSMPIAGMVFWGVVALASLRLPPMGVALVVLFGSGMVFPLGVIIDRLRGRTLRSGTGGNPVAGMFFQSLGMVALLWPLVLVAAYTAHDPNLYVLGGAIIILKTAVTWPEGRM